ncbi:MAG: hypothetical protein AAF696_26105 [Bacteroidota bacterium]
MKNTIFLFLSIYLLIACQSGKKAHKISSTNKADNTLLLEKFAVGDYLKLNQGEIQIEALILDQRIEEGKTWLSICFLNKGKLFGRQVPNGMKGDCADLLDLAAIQPDSLKEYELIKKIKLDQYKIHMGSFRYVFQQEELTVGYEYGLKQREKKQTPCNEFLLDLEAVRECYFDLSKIVMS